MNDIFERIFEKKFVFLGTFFLVFTFSYLVLVAIDFLPEEPTVENDTAVTTGAIEMEEEFEVMVEFHNFDNDETVEEATEETKVSEGEVLGSSDSNINAVTAVTSVDTVDFRDTIIPTSIYIEKLDKTTAVLNPTSRTISDLDNALLSGVVRHPDSATLDQDGNVFILGHSSYLPRVFNKNFQAFNGIQNLVWGDVIKVYSDDFVFEYQVEKVYKAKAQDATVPIAGTGKMLTLATCNSFGSVDDRYIVEAKQVSVKEL